MPFHPNRRKPSPPGKKLQFPWWHRLWLAGLGAFLAWLGSYPRNPANFMYWNWHRQPVYPNSLAPIGAVLMVVSFIPASWMERAANRLLR